MVQKNDIKNLAGSFDYISKGSAIILKFTVMIVTPDSDSYTVKNTVDFTVKYCKMRRNVTVCNRVYKKQPNTVFLHSILHAIVD